MTTDFEQHDHNHEDCDCEQNILSLLDEDGVEHEFEVVDAADFEDEHYVALIPISNSAQELVDSDGDLVILKVLEEDGEEILSVIEDDDEFDRVSDFFIDRLADEFDIEDGDEAEAD